MGALRSSLPSNFVCLLASKRSSVADYSQLLETARLKIAFLKICRLLTINFLSLGNSMAYQPLFQISLNMV